MTLEDLWNAQTAQQKLFYDGVALTPEERAAVTSDLLDNLWEEVGDIPRRIRNRQHILLRAESPLDLYTLAEDGADVLKLLIALLDLHGVDADLFARAFADKTRVVADRHEASQLKLHNQVRVIMCDLDDVMAEWTRSFIHFAWTEFAMVIQPHEINEPRMEPVKDAFDRSGRYATLDPKPGAVETAAKWRARGYKWVLVTARPHRRFRQLYADTLAWLRRVGVEHDHLIFNRDKAEAARSLAPATVVALVEDRSKHAIEVASIGIPVLKLPGNDGHHVTHPNIRQCSTWAEVDAQLEALTAGEANDIVA